MSGRLLLSLAAGLAVAAMVLLCAWYQLGVSMYYREHRRLDVDRSALQESLNEHQVKTGSYPAALSELNLQSDPRTASNFSFDAQGNPLDPWGTAYTYTRTVKSYELGSLGHDGRQGGSGFDSDVLLHDDARVRISIQPATFRQFVLDPATAGVRAGCMIAGLFAFVVCLVSVRGPKPLTAARLTPLLITLAMSVLVAAVLSALHIPSGH
jgi:hypothetical protein